ncbi:hypothetical protein BY458DRAFT_490677 [Sporodiniella umbellata]|nr:hypothetical protein BY458DRAFT_490677 [Sporodiniella umbellata]
MKYQVEELAFVKYFIASPFSKQDSANKACLSLQHQIVSKCLFKKAQHLGGKHFFETMGKKIGVSDKWLKNSTNMEIGVKKLHFHITKEKEQESHKEHIRTSFPFNFENVLAFLQGRLPQCIFLYSGTSSEYRNDGQALSILVLWQCRTLTEAKLAFSHIEAFNLLKRKYGYYTFL